jgi:hypothetical protein
MLLGRDCQWVTHDLVRGVPYLPFDGRTDVDQVCFQIADPDNVCHVLREEAIETVASPQDGLLWLVRGALFRRSCLGLATRFILSTLAVDRRAVFQCV